MRSKINSIVKDVKKKTCQLEVLAKSIEGKYLWRHLLWTDNPGQDEITVKFNKVEFREERGLLASISTSVVTTDKVTKEVYKTSDHSLYSRSQLQHFIETCVDKWEKVK